MNSNTAEFRQKSNPQRLSSPWLNENEATNLRENSISRLTVREHYTTKIVCVQKQIIKFKWNNFGDPFRNFLNLTV